jgi:predicted lactoylglutathione lyase
MSTKMFVNLPVKDLKRSIEFFTSLGNSFDPRFSNDKGTCMIIGPDSFVMLLVEDFFKTFTPKEITDTRSSTECIICLSADNRGAVDDLINKAVRAGGKTYREKEDHGFMYSHAYSDLDGHLWEVMYMDVDAFMKVQMQGAVNVGP